MTDLGTHRHARAVKRPFDVTIALFALILLSPLIVAVAPAVAMRLGRPVLFRQVCPGLGGKLFTILKFPTMADRRGPHGSLLPDFKRLPPFGEWLRSQLASTSFRSFGTLFGATGASLGRGLC